MSTLHANLEHASFLIGKWKGTGQGIYPTAKPFEYLETIEISALGAKPVLHYISKSFDKTTNSPLHAETGYIRFPTKETVEFVLTHPFGVTEISEGKIQVLVQQETSAPASSVTIEATSTSLQRVASAKEPFVTGLKRLYQFQNNELSYVIDMATTKTPMTKHLTCTLQKEVVPQQ